MGTKVQSKTYLPGYYSMRDLNEDYSSCSRPLFYGNRRILRSQQHYDGFPPRTMVDTNSGFDKDAVKYIMLEHEAVFKKQVYELHRLYRIQRDLMDETKRNDSTVGDRAPLETLFSSSFRAPQVTSEGATKWHMPNFPSASPLSCHSPLSSKNWGCSQVSSIPYQNGESSKGVEVLDARPIKTRRMMIDLTLPPEEYIDSKAVEKVKDDPLCGTSSRFANGNLKVESRNCLADLNEPIEVQETNSSAYDFSQVHGTCHERMQECVIFPGKKGGALGLSKEKPLSTHQTRADLLNCANSGVNSDSGRWIPGIIVAGDRSSHKVVSPFIRSDRIIPSTDTCKLDAWGDKRCFAEEINARNQDIFRDNHRESSVASNTLSIRQSNPTESGRPLNQWFSTWDNSSSGLGQKYTGSRISPFLNSSECVLASASRHGPLGEGVQYPEFSNRATPGYKTCLPNQNGLYHGSPIVSNCNRGNHDAASEQFKKHADASIFASSIYANKNILRDNVNILNSSYGDTVFRRGVETLEMERCDERAASIPWLSHKPVFKTETTNARNDFNHAVLHYSNSLGSNGKLERGQNNSLGPQLLKSVSCSNNIEDSGTPITHCSPSLKSPGYPSFDKPYSNADRNHQSDRQENKLKNRVLDINMPCETTDLASDELCVDAISGGKRTETKAVSSRPFIDLNVCMNEDEGPLLPHSPKAKRRLNMMIDLEALPDPGNEEEDHNLLDGHKEPLKFSDHVQSQDQHMKTAADVLVAISSSSIDAVHPFEGSEQDILCWFAETIIHSCGKVVEDKVDTTSERSNEDRREYSCRDIDYFEAMTLNLKELTKEEYFPPPLVPESLDLDEPGPVPALTRPRRGNARRGRQRRDFQRDILPGLSSLSRHEVTEDLQTFGGLMRATGYTWQLGLTRRGTGRGGGRRGRRRAAATVASRNQYCAPLSSPSTSAGFQPNSNSVDMTLEDRSLTGWGKMTRRPRRQRCRQSVAFT